MRELPLARVGLLLVLPLLMILGLALLPSRTFAIRDAGHYYGPLWRYVNAQWPDELPLWNSLEENGRPLAADATASVFYPAKAVFLLPLQFDTALEIFVAAHLVLAAGGTFATARSFGLSRDSACLASVSYTFGGAIVFLHCNPIFLVGAAWLPVGFGSVRRLLVRGDALAVVSFAAVLALMTLGGDPQSAYVLILVGLIGVSGGWFRCSTPAPRRLHQLGWLTLATGLALGLSAVQVLPTLSWARESDRATFDAPRSVTEIATEALRTGAVDATGLASVPRPGTHRSAIYQFSIGPWRWLELFWPNISGRPFPTNQRWIGVVPAEGRYWTPSLYMGLVPILLGLSAVSGVRSQPIRMWLMACALLFSAACLGYFGVAWLVNELRHLFGASPTSVWSPVGGAYWWMTVVLPGFVSFRYPAKLWTVVALSLSLLAAVRSDQILNSPVRPLQRTLAVYLSLTGVLLVLSACWGRQAHDLMSVGDDMIYGPFDPTGASAGVTAALIQGFLVGAVIWFAVWRRHSVDRKLIRLILLVTVMDLTVANAWLVPSVSVDRPPRPTLPSSVAGSGRTNHSRYLRWAVDGWYPTVWSHETDRGRLSSLIRWDRDTLRPKYNLDASLVAVRSSTSFSSASHCAALELLAEHREDKAVFQRLADLMGIRYVIAPSRIQLAGQFSPAANLAAGQARIWRNHGEFPRAWIVHESRIEPKPRSRRWQDLRHHMRQTLVESGIDFRHCVVLDDDAHAVSRSTAEASESTQDEKCDLVQSTARTLIIDVELTRPGYLVISDAYSRGWHCTARSELPTPSDLPVLRANGIMRAVPLSTGRHRLVMAYRPGSFYLGALISAFSWCGLLILLICTLCIRNLA